ncbi:MAG TPA: ParA family protein [Methylovirgula sp.]
MRTIAFINQKGGTGKSTLAACLAVAAKEAGERVFLIDMDPQKSLLKWGHRRKDKDLPVEAISESKLETVLTALGRGRVSLVLIDTPATESPAAEAAMRCADLCVIPARPTIFDIWSSESTRGKLKTLGRDYVFALTQCSPMPDNARVKDGASALEAMGALLQPFVCARVDYQEAARQGLGVTEFCDDGKAAEEMRQLWASLQRRCAMLKPNGKGTRAA